MKRIILAIAVACCLPSCANMTPDERAFWLRTGERVVIIGLDRLDTKHPQK